ncbi:hypothetical protein E2C01_046231 [Portunus trituberculatus]|uniref:Uncharacterized protein n=1 Tax=Portunus trituberculatus TaxID=210409 RepID=A0A5B7G539_PORTR|nr:hypothetical protein [Portunus trituberculatus]
MKKKKSWQEEVLASVNTPVAFQLGVLHGSVPPPATDPSLPAVPSSSDPDLMQFSVPPPQSPNAKWCVHSHQARGQGGAVQGLEVPLKHSLPPKDDARRIRKSHPTSVMFG